MTLPRNRRQPQPMGRVVADGGANQGQEVRLVPYFDGVGPRTSANGSLDTKQGNLFEYF